MRDALHLYCRRYEALLRALLALRAPRALAHTTLSNSEDLQPRNGKDVPDAHTTPKKSTIFQFARLTED